MTESVRLLFIDLDFDIRKVYLLTFLLLKHLPVLSLLGYVALRLGYDFTGHLELLTIVLRGSVILGFMDLYVFTLDLLNAFLLCYMVVPVFVELREAGAYIIDEQLGEFLVALDDEAEELPVVVVDYVSKLLLEREWLESLPSLRLSLEDKDSVLKLEHLLRLRWDELFVLPQHATEDDDVIRVEAECKVVCHLLWHLYIQHCPYTKLSVISFYTVEELILC